MKLDLIRQDFYVVIIIIKLSVMRSFVFFQGAWWSTRSQRPPDGPQQETAAGVWRFPREHQVGRRLLNNKHGQYVCNGVDCGQPLKNHFNAVTNQFYPTEISKVSSIIVSTSNVMRWIYS